MIEQEHTPTWRNCCQSVQSSPFKRQCGKTEPILLINLLAFHTLLEISYGRKCTQAYASLFLNERHFSTLLNLLQEPPSYNIRRKSPLSQGENPSADTVRQRVMSLTFTTWFACMATRPLQITFDLCISSCASSRLRASSSLPWLFSRHGICFLAAPSSAHPPHLADSCKMEKA